MRAAEINHAEGQRELALSFALKAVRLDPQPSWLVWVAERWHGLGQTLPACTWAALALKHPAWEGRARAQGLQNDWCQELNADAHRWMDTLRQWADDPVKTSEKNTQHARGAPGQLRKDESLKALQEAVANRDAASIIHAFRHDLQVTGCLRAEWGNVCGVLLTSNLPVLAEAAGKLALRVDPLNLPALVNLPALGTHTRRVTEYQGLAFAAAVLAPRQAAVWANLSAIHDIARRPWETERYARKALELNPKMSAAVNNLANALKEQGRISEAVPLYRQAHAQRPQDRSIFSNLMLALQYAANEPPDGIAQDHMRYHELYEKAVAPLISEAGPWPESRPVRIGFVSADMFAHAVSYFLLPLWDHLDQERFHKVAYMCRKDEDAVSEQLRSSATLWRNVFDLDDEQLAQVIRQDNIDVLVDLSGHTNGNRLGVFARRPAPLQITWLGHPNTTGLRRMHGRITCDVADPPGVEQRYSEHLLRLPDSFCVYRPKIVNPQERYTPAYQVAPAPALQKGYITFGSCNNLAKITDRTVALWAAVLNAVPQSTLLLEAAGLDKTEFQQQITKRFAGHGVAAQRLEMLPRRTATQYLIYHRIDIALDPTPCNGGTTTFDLLWMGLPLVTLRGDSFVSRMGETLLRALGRAEWVAPDEQAYVRVACELAADTARLNRDRLLQRARMESSPLMDEVAFARHFKAAIEALWTKVHMEESARSSTNAPAKPSPPPAMPAPDVAHNLPPPALDVLGTVPAPGPAVAADFVGQLRAADAHLTGGHWKAAETAFQTLADQDPDHPDVLFGLGMANYQLGDFMSARRRIITALWRKPHPVWKEWYLRLCVRAGHDLLAWALLHHLKLQGHELKTFPQGLRGLEEELRKRILEMPENAHLQDKVLELVPTDLRARVDARLRKQATKSEFVRCVRAGDNARAEQLGAALLATSGHDPHIVNNFGILMRRRGDYQRATQFYQRVQWIEPTNADSLCNLGNLLVEKGSPGLAAVALEIASLIAPESKVVWINLAVAYNQAGVYPWEAQWVARKALALDPNDPVSQRQLATALVRSGQANEAMALFREIVPHYNDFASAYLLCLVYASDADPEFVSAEHWRLGGELEQPHRGVGAWKRTRGGMAALPSMPKRVGFISADLRKHSVAYFALPMFEQLHRLGYEVHAYFNHGASDHVTEKFKAASTQWRSVIGLPDDAVARMIADDHVDILFDLSGHTGGHRLPVLARQPAPLQVTWLGHPASTGLRSIQARLTDDVADPDGAEGRYTEKLWRLPGAFCVYRPLVDRPQDRHKPEFQVRPTPALANGFITFGCCNNLAKVTPPVVAAWAQVMAAVPTSRLLIEAPGLFGGAFRSVVLQRFVSAGVDPSRIRLVDRDSARQYLTYHDIDIALDPFPCNGGTTSFDLLWMGVPLVTLAGGSFVSRMGASLVSGVGQPDWACTDADAYVAKAAELASDWEALNRIRLGLRERVENGPLGDEQAYGDKVSQVLQAMWSHRLETLDRET